MAVNPAVPRVKPIDVGGPTYTAGSGGGGGRVSPPPGQGRGQGRGGNQGRRFNAAKSSWGLNLGDRTPFNPFGMPKTQGAFNTQVLQESQPQYLPLLQGIQGDVTAENAATKERGVDIGSIYNQYQTQAQKAFNETQDALKELAVQNAGGDQTAQANLAAALNSAGGGQSSLDQMMGMTAPTGGALPYLNAASGATAATQAENASLGTGAIGLEGENLANVGNERATQLNTEDLRHGAALQGLQGQRSAIEQQIPGIIAKTREQLISDLENAQALRFQQNLASRQFGLSSQAQAFNQRQSQQNFRETQLNDASNRAAQAAQIRQNAQALQNQQAATKTATQAALAKAQGQQQANAIKYLSSWMAPTKQELATKTITDKNGNPVKQTGLADPGRWHRDVGSALRTLTTVYGLDQATALQIMAAVGGSTYISGQGGQTVADWANSFAQRQKAQKNVFPPPGYSRLTPNPPIRLPRR